MNIVEIMTVVQTPGRLSITARAYPQCEVVEDLPNGRRRVVLLEPVAGMDLASGVELTVPSLKITAEEVLE